MPKFRVKKGQRVRVEDRRYKGGEIVELTVEAAKAMPWAVEPVGAAAQSSDKDGK